MLTAKGTFVYGIERDGVWHKEYEMRLPTLEDVEQAIEGAQAEAGPEASRARIDRHKWAACLTRLGSIPEKDITPDLLAGLASTEFKGLSDTEEALLKKLADASAGSAPSA